VTIAPSVPGPTPTTAAGTAAADLAAFFSAVAATDTDIRAAAAGINGGIHTDRVVVEPAVADAIGRAERGLQVLGSAIPAGLDPELRDAVLLVTSDQHWRWAAVRCWAGPLTGTFPRPGDDADRLIGCLGDGSVPAARFAGDVSAARALAAARPPLSPVAPDSREIGELLVRLNAIAKLNAGCDSNGGYRMSTPLTLTWYDSPRHLGYGDTEEGQVTVTGAPGPAGPTQTVDVAFHAVYAPADPHQVRGWVAYVLAC
jgi:hypothetical protein